MDKEQKEMKIRDRLKRMQSVGEYKLPQGGTAPRLNSNKRSKSQVALPLKKSEQVAPPEKKEEPPGPVYSYPNAEFILTLTTGQQRLYFLNKAYKAWVRYIGTSPILFSLII